VENSPNKTCAVVRAGDGYSGKQGFSYVAGVSAETVGAEQICMQHVTVPPGARARAHLHHAEEAVYVLSGAVEMFFGEGLEQTLTAGTGDFMYIPPGVPHCPRNLSRTEPATGLTARVTPREQEDTVLLPELDVLLDKRLAQA